jgi:hypothetical protein
MPGRVLRGPWSQRQGFAVLLAFVLPCALLSCAYMLLVKWIAGFEATDRACRHTC